MNARAVIAAIAAAATVAAAPVATASPQEGAGSLVTPSINVNYVWGWGTWGAVGVTYQCPTGATTTIELTLVNQVNGESVTAVPTTVTCDGTQQSATVTYSFAKEMKSGQRVAVTAAVAGATSTTTLTML